MGGPGGMWGPVGDVGAPGGMWGPRGECGGRLTPGGNPGPPPLQAGPPPLSPRGGLPAPPGSHPYTGIWSRLPRRVLRGPAHSVTSRLRKPRPHLPPGFPGRSAPVLPAASAPRYSCSGGGGTPTQDGILETTGRPPPGPPRAPPPSPSPARSPPPGFRRRPFPAGLRLASRPRPGPTPRGHRTCGARARRGGGANPPPPRGARGRGRGGRGRVSEAGVPARTLRVAGPRGAEGSGCRGARSPPSLRGVPAPRSGARTPRPPGDPWGRCPVPWAPLAFSRLGTRADALPAPLRPAGGGAETLALVAGAASDVTRKPLHQPRDGKGAPHPARSPQDGLALAPHGVEPASLASG